MFLFLTHVNVKYFYYILFLDVLETERWQTKLFDQGIAEFKQANVSKYPHDTEDIIDISSYNVTTCSCERSISVLNRVNHTLEQPKLMNALLDFVCCVPTGTK